MTANSSQAALCVSGSPEICVDHFPGNPIVPAASLIQGVLAQLEPALTASPYVLLSKFRFRQEIRPDSQLEIHSEQKTAQKWQVQAKQADGATAFSGTVATTSTPAFDSPVFVAAGAASGERELTTAASRLAAAYQMLPYGSSMQLLEKLHRLSPEQAVAETQQASSCIDRLSITKYFPIVCLLELACQAMAVHACSSAHAAMGAHTKPRVVGLSKLLINNRVQPQDLPVHVAVQLLSQNSSGASYSFRISQQHEALLQGKLLAML